MNQDTNMTPNATTTKPRNIHDPALLAFVTLVSVIVSLAIIEFFLSF